MRRLLSFMVAVCLSVYASAASQFSVSHVPDSSRIRERLVETWFDAPLSVVRMNMPEVHETPGGTFEVRMEETETTFSIVVAPRAQLMVTTFSAAGERTEIQDVYYTDAPGSWVLTRSKATGAPLFIRLYFSYNSDIFVQLSPVADGTASRTNVDFMLYNMYATRAVPLHMPFTRFYGVSLGTLVQWTARTVPWHYADVYPGVYRAVKQMIGVIRNRLPDIVYREDALYDERGNPISVATGKARVISAADGDKLSLSSCGFVKWIADGLVEPLAGGGLLRAPLIVPTVTNSAVGYQGVLSQAYNLSLALDWTRNLASAIRAVESGVELRYPDSDVDVRLEPFVAESTPGGVARVTGYLADNGYSMTQLRALLYVLAVTDPGKFYFGAIRDTDRSRTVQTVAADGTRTTEHLPEVKVFNTCVALFPYFDDNGRFACAVFADGAEYELSSLIAQYRKEFIHLVRVNASDQFYPR